MECSRWEVLAGVLYRPDHQFVIATTSITEKEKVQFYMKKLFTNSTFWDTWWMNTIKPFYVLRNGSGYLGRNVSTGIQYRVMNSYYEEVTPAYVKDYTQLICTREELFIGLDQFGVNVHNGNQTLVQFFKFGQDLRGIKASYCNNDYLAIVAADEFVRIFKFNYPEPKPDPKPAPTPKLQQSKTLILFWVLLSSSIVIAVGVFIFCILKKYRKKLNPTQHNHDEIYQNFQNPSQQTESKL